MEINTKKNPEADALIAQNGGKSFAQVELAADFVIELAQNQNLLFEMSENAGNFVHSQPNSSEIILRKILEIVKLWRCEVVLAVLQLYESSTLQKI